MSEIDPNELLKKLDELKSSDGSKVNQIVMLCLQAFMIMFMTLKPLCRTWMRYKYNVKDSGGNTTPRNSTGSF